MKQYNKLQMRAMARMILGYDHNMPGAEIEQTDGLDVNAILDKALRAWYLKFIDSADREMLNVESPERMSVTQSRIAGATFLTIIDDARRVFSIQHDGWACPARILPADKLSDIIERQQNPYTAATAITPVAVMHDDCRHILAWPPAQGGNCIVDAVIDHGDDVYALDDRALETLAQYLNSQSFKNFFPS